MVAAFPRYIDCHGRAVEPISIFPAVVGSGEAENATDWPSAADEIVSDIFADTILVIAPPVVSINARRVFAVLAAVDRVCVTDTVPALLAIKKLQAEYVGAAHEVWVSASAVPFPVLAAMVTRCPPLKMYPAVFLTNSPVPE